MYYDWLLDVANLDERTRTKYNSLLNTLYSIPFYCRNPMDTNRIDDGFDLRSLYIDNGGWVEGMPACSILEVMVALANRCEKYIMSDPDLGNRTDVWFMAMLESLTLLKFDEDSFDRDIVEDILINFLERKYGKDGKGGLFYIENFEENMRKLDIWQQMCRYIDHYYSFV